jgi:glycosyltransferase involved in cell wall biosynthesis
LDLVTHQRGAHGSRIEPLLSIVIPAYNEEQRLPRTLEEIASWVETFGEPTEVIVVENGSTDGTVKVVRAFQATHPFVSLIRDVPRGKGRAVREGMLSARGALRFLCDADLSMPIQQIERFLPTIDAGAEVAIGSREAPGARRFGEPGYRHLMGRVFNLVVKLVALPDLEDSQCGFKLFSSRAAEEVFNTARMEGWGFDPEVLFIARKRGYRIVEVPIDWHFNADSRVRPVHDTLAMVRDVLMIRLNDWRGEYDA